jgi:hypothetical protein
VAHFVMVLSRSQAGEAAGVQGPAWGVPAVLPGTPLEQQHFDTGGCRVWVECR